MKVQWKRIWKIIAPYVIECLIENLSLLKKGDKKEESIQEHEGVSLR